MEEPSDGGGVVMEVWAKFRGIGGVHRGEKSERVETGHLSMRQNHGDAAGMEGEEAWPSDVPVPGSQGATGDSEAVYPCREERGRSDGIEDGRKPGVRVCLSDSAVN